MFVACRINQVNGLLPVSSYERLGVELSLKSVEGFILVISKRKTWRQFTQPLELYECISVGSIKTVLVFKWVLNVFFRPFCLVWNLAVRGCSLLPLSTLCSVRALCVTVCLTVTQSGSPGVRVSAAQCVSRCQEEQLCEQPKIKKIISDFGLINRKRHNSSGKLQDSCVTWWCHWCDVIYWSTQVKIKSLM